MIAREVPARCRAQEFLASWPFPQAEPYQISPFCGQKTCPVLFLSHDWGKCIISELDPPNIIVA